MSRTAQVELMTHPAIDDEFEFLSSDRFATALAGTTVGNFEGLKHAV